jgi:hypothetical protein
MSVQSLNNGQLQLSELVISNEKYTGATGYVASTSTFSSSVNGTSLTIPSLTTTGSITSTEGNVGVIAPNSGATTYATNGLTLSRNISDGQDEYDIIAVNTLTENSLNIYTSNVSVIGGVTQPTLALSSTGNVSADRGTISSVMGFVASGGNSVLNTYTDSTFAITRNISDGNDEWDIVAINSIDPNQCLNIFAGDGTTEINNGTAPILSIGTAGTTTTGIITSSNGGGNIDIGIVGNVGGTTYDTDSTLTITRNLTSGDNEFDFIAINSTTGVGMNFYASQTEASDATKPSLSVTTTGISAPLYTGGIGCTQSTQSVTVASGGLITKTVSIPNFIGTSTTTAYVIAPNTTPAYFNYTCYYLGLDGAGGTNVNVGITNTYSSSITESVTFSIIAMNF